MSLLPLIIGLSLLFFLLSIALYSQLKLIAAVFGRQQMNTFIISLLWSALYIAIFIAAHVFSDTFLRFISYYLGAISLGFYLSLGFWLIILIARLFQHQRLILQPVTGVVFISLLVGLTSTAIANFHKPLVIEEVNLVTTKISRPYRFIQISDIQFGTSTKSEMDKILQTAYSLHPDFIVFTGDLIDFDNYIEEDFSSLAASPVPIYFERGNHEFYHDPTRLLSYLETIGPIHLLINQKAYVDELEIIGIDFGNTEDYLSKQLQTFTLNNSKYSILLYHEPKDVPVAVAKGFDLLLFGHTHAGQIWPYTLLVDWMYQYSDGLYTLGDSTIYTSDGASLWGPRMRLGSQNEIVVFNLRPVE